jgi:hypothetical protein
MVFAVLVAAVGIATAFAYGTSPGERAAAMVAQMNTTEKFAMM